MGLLLLHCLVLNRTYIVILNLIQVPPLIRIKKAT